MAQVAATAAAALRSKNGAEAEQSGVDVNPLGGFEGAAARAVGQHCRVAACTENHRSHYCKVCGSSDSDHFSRECQQLQHDGPKLTGSLSGAAVAGWFDQEAQPACQCVFSIPGAPSGW